MNRIQTRWTKEKKISSKDVDLLLDSTNRLLMMLVGDEFKRVGRTPIDDIIGDLFK